MIQENVVGSNQGYLGIKVKVEKILKERKKKESGIGLHTFLHN
jgi:hypothetical protein